MTSNIDPNPIVTVTVVTYNSSKYVLETLESIKNQTYPHLSLIVSDDCSTDKTVEVCKKWMRLNESRFVETQILESPINTGVSANGNRGAAACKTKWVKGIAGDDLLMPNCIQDNVDYVLSHPDVVYLFSKIEVFGDSMKRNMEIESLFKYDFFSLSSQEQLEILIFSGNCIPAATTFYNLDKIRAYGISNDERIPMLEDLPKWINCLRKGIRFHFMDRKTVLYRIHQSSLSTGTFSSARFYSSQRLYYYYYLRDAFIERYGVDKVIVDDVEEQSNIYQKYCNYRFLPASKIYFFFSHVFSKLFTVLNLKKI